MTSHMIFAPTGTVAPKNRGSNYRAIHLDLLAQMRRDEIERHTDKHTRHLDSKRNFKQTGATS